MEVREWVDKRTEGNKGHGELNAQIMKMMRVQACNVWFSFFGACNAIKGRLGRSSTRTIHGSTPRRGEIGKFHEVQKKRG